MTILRSIPRQRKMPALRNVVMIDTWRGVLRVRKWPKKYGKARSALQQYWIDWFRQANLLAKYADGMAQARAIEITKGSGLYPRDVMLKAMRGRLYVWQDARGWKWYPVAAIQDISESLDVLAQTVGSVLVRATDRWRAALGGTTGYVLTHQGPAVPPKWAAPGGGISQEELAESPLVLDGTASEYILAVSPYLSVSLILESVVLSAVNGLQVQLSTDDGVSYHSTVGDYFNFSLTATAEANSYGAQFFLHDAPAVSTHFASAQLAMLQVIRTTWETMSGLASASVMKRQGFTSFDGPITHVKIKSSAGATFNSGAIRAFGIAAA